MKKVKILTAVALAAAIAVGIFYACQKDLLTDGGEIKSHIYGKAECRNVLLGVYAFK